MVVRVRNLANDVIQSNDTDTFSVNLPRDGILHSLLVRVQATNGSTSGRNLHPLELADTFRVVGDGDRRFFDVTGDELQKWNEVWSGKSNPMDVNENADAAQWIEFLIPFGRQVVDNNMYLPLSRIESPRLEIPYALTPAADGGIAAGTVQFNVQALWSADRDVGQYIGTLATRTIKTFTTAASGDDETDITIRNPIRAIGIYAYEPGIAFATDITRIRLVANSGEFDIFWADAIDFEAMNHLLFGGNIDYSAILFLQDADTWDSRISRIAAWSLAIEADVSVSGDTFEIIQVDTVAADRLTFNAAQADITAGAETFTDFATDQALRINVRGLMPSFFGLMPFGYNGDVSEYLNPRDYSDLRVILTNGGVGADARISIQELLRL